MPILKLGPDTSSFGKTLFKDINLVVFGKTCENIRKEVGLNLSVTISKPNFVRAFQITNKLAIIERTKAKVLLNKPMYIGCAILKRSKLLMFDFQFGLKNISLLFTNTDSLAYHIKHKNPQKVIAKKMEKFDLRNHDKDAMNMMKIDPVLPLENINKAGLMKDDFIGHRAKMYHFPDSTRKVTIVRKANWLLKC